MILAENNLLVNFCRFLLDAVTTIESDEDGGKVYATMVEVFSVSLPSHFQDHDLAEEFATIAVQLSPDCSKPNHRMGIFQWMKVRLNIYPHYKLLLKYQIS